MCRQVMGRPATRAASCFEADSGCTASGRVRLASARSCVPLRMRSITTGVSHLGADPSSDHRSHIILSDARGCDDGSATRCTCSRALAGGLGSEGQKCPAHPKRGQIESATLRSLSERLTLVAAVTSTLLRHGRLRAETNPPGTLVGNPKFPPCILVSQGKPNPADWPRPPSYNARACFVPGATT